MSDRIEPMFRSLSESLSEQHPPAPFAAPEAVRGRGRQRARRQVALAGVAMLAVGGVGVTAAAAAVTGQHAPPTPPAGGPFTHSPTPSFVPARFLLEPEDLGAGDWHGGWQPEWTEGPHRWLWEGICPHQRTVASLAERIDQQEVGWTDGPDRPGTGFGFADTPDWVHQVVDLFAPGGGAANLADTRMAVTCGEGFEIVEEDFVGDDSLLVREPGPAYTAVVRVGEAVTTVRAYGGELGRADQDRARDLAAAAADRMR